MEQGRQIGEWRCQKLLGRGSFGSVGLWKNMKTGSYAAIKRFEIRSAVQPNDKLCTEMQKRWQKEVDIMYNSIDCQFVVSTIPVPPDFADKDLTGDLTESQSQLSRPLPLLCMEYCSGGDLRRFLKRPENICGLREKDIRTILEHVSKAVSYLHEKSIIHRDLKPENILIYYDSGNNVIYKLSDLGFAKDLSNSSNLCSTVVGTLQYLAPEIYLGKMYDKTVDYWSFGLIAFEIMTGVRPFLHGESPSQWLPLVEEKPKDAICIYRKDDRSIEFAKIIPFYTHCTELFKQCIETWLRTMLQLDPSRRGKKLSAPDTTESRSPSPSMPLVGLQMLSTILSTKSLHIRTISRRLGFAIGKSTKMSDIQQLIARDTGLPIENQLILTNDGVDVKGHDLASSFVDLTDLFLIPRSPELVRQRLKMPKSVNTFLTSWQNIKDPLKLRMIWSCAVYFIQSELEKVETLKKASSALKSWINSNYVVELRSLQGSIDKSGACLEKILELEQRLTDLEKEAKRQVDLDEESPTGSLSFWRSEMEALRSFYVSSIDDWCENVVLKPVSESRLEEIYYTVLRIYDEGRCSDGSISGAYSEALVTNVCQFVVQRDQIAEAVTHNCTIQLEKIKKDHSLVQSLQQIVEKLNALTNDVIESRCRKQKVLLGLQQTNNGTQSTTSKKLNPVGASNPNSMVGGSRPSGKTQAHHELMSKSESSTVTKKVSSNSSPSASPKKKNVVMARSLNSPLHGRLCPPSPPVAKLMEESMMIKSQTEDTLKNLDSTLGRINSILQESEELDWEFLDS